MAYKSFFKLLTAFFSVLFIIAAFLPFLKTKAQTKQEPQLIVTWQSQNYQPANYSGKNLPTVNSPIIAAVELIDNNKLINLSSAQITWFQNSDIIVKGSGLKRIALNVNGLAGDRLLIEADIVYKGKELQGAAIVPVVEPKAVIAAPHAFNREIKTGTHHFKAIPFFFNIKNLNELLFSWTVNEQQETVDQNSDILNLEITSENSEPVPINLKASISNINNIIETARDEIRFVLIP